MYDQAYRDGREGRSYTSGSYDSYVRGKKSRSGGVDLGDGGAGGAFVALMMLLTFIVVAALVALWTALTALLGALLLAALAKVWSRSYDLTYERSFRACFYGMLTYTLTTAAVVGACWLLLYNGIGQPIAERIAAAFREVWQDTDEQLRVYRTVTYRQGFSALASATSGHAGLFAAALGVLWGPGLLAAGGVFMRHVPALFNGLRGYMKAVVSALFVLVPSMIVTNWLIAVLAALSKPASLPSRTLEVAWLLGSLGLIAYALLGGLLAAATTYIAMRFMVGKGSVTLGTCYGTAVLAFLGYGASIMLALYFFREGDALMYWLVAVASAPAPWEHALSTIYELPGSLLEFLPLQLPGLLICGAFVVTRFGRPFNGYLGFVKASFLGGAVALVLLFPFLFLAVLGAVTRVVL